MNTHRQDEAKRVASSDKIAVGQHVKDMAAEVQQHSAAAVGDMGQHMKNIADEVSQHTQNAFEGVGEHAQGLADEVVTHTQHAANEVWREMPVLIEHVKDTLGDIFDAGRDKVGK